MQCSIYILRSKVIAKTYVGFTFNITERLRAHNSGKVNTTKYYKPWKIIHVEEVANLAIAKHREQYWKSGAGRRNISKIVQGSRPTFRKLGEARSIS